MTDEQKRVTALEARLADAEARIAALDRAMGSRREAAFDAWKAAPLYDAIVITAPDGRSYTVAPYNQQPFEAILWMFGQTLCNLKKSQENK